MKRLARDGALSLPLGGPVILVTAVGTAAGAQAAAAALACAASEPDRAALLIDFGERRAPRSSLVATAGARELEERLVAHLPDAAVASRGRICRLGLAADPAAIEQLPTALPLARESVAVVHLPTALLRPLLGAPRIRPTAALLRADLAEDRALTALAARDLMTRGLRVAVLKRRPSRLVERAALLGVLSSGALALPGWVGSRLLAEDKRLQQCYDQENGAEDEQTQAPGQRGEK